jgi:WD40 repeat protein
MALNPLGHKVIQYNPVGGAISICDTQRARLDHSVINPLFPFTVDLAVGELGIYFVIDLVVGSSIAFRIEYGNCIANFYQISRFDSDDVPSTCVSDVDQLAATFCDQTLTLWHLCQGTVHRRLQFSSPITAVAFDAQAACLFVATREKCVYMSVNADILCEMAIARGGPQISVVAFGSALLSRSKRMAICGTTTGELWLVSPVFDTKSMVIDKPLSLHQSRIRRLVLNRSKTAMLSIDAAGHVCLWTSLGVPGPKLRSDVYGKCASCNERPTIWCTKCSRALCAKCSHERQPGPCPVPGDRPR